MRLSCNGCRVLRKGCSGDCSIRPCLDWIKNPESQANATVFLAKFYGRAGLINLINAGPQHLRPAIFRSLLYEACGRIVNPINGSVGLMWSGSWQLCQNAVEAVLNGAPITQVATDAAEAKDGPPLKAAFDIRHVIKDKEDNLSGSGDLHRVRTRCRFKRIRVWVASPNESGIDNEPKRSQSHESAVSHESATAEPMASRHSEESLCSGEERLDVGDGIELDLSLGLEPIKRSSRPINLKMGDAIESSDDTGFCKMELGLQPC